MSRILTPYQKPLFGAMVDRSHKLAKGLVGLWLFNEGTGSVLYDCSGNGNHGTLTGMDSPSTGTSGWNVGPYGPVLAFDGSNDHVVISDSDTLVNAYTEMTWVIKAKEISFVDNAGLIDKYSTSSDRSFRLLTKLTSRIEATLAEVGTSGTAYGGVNYDGLINGIWDTLVITYRGNEYIRRYKGGMLISSEANTMASLYNNVRSMWFGRGLAYFNGQIDHISIYKRALSDLEVADLTSSPYSMFSLDTDFLNWKQQAAASVSITPPVGSLFASGVALRNDRGIFVPTEVDV